LALVPRDDEFLKVESDDQTVIVGRRFDVPAALLQARRKLAIHADEVVLRGPYTAQYAELYLNCRTLVCDGNATIDVSGADGQGYLVGFKPPIQGSPGVDGDAGDDGKPGVKGGVIVIVSEKISGSLKLVAQGGKGGRAQDGGDGTGGTHGARGLDGIDLHGHESGEPGKPGGKGGDAGKAGTPGAGGDGGTINVICASDPKTVECYARGGEPSDKAEHGAPGAGGPGGIGGQVHDCTLVGGGDDPVASISFPLNDHHRAAVEAFLSFSSALADRPEPHGPHSTPHWECHVIDKHQPNGANGANGRRELTSSARRHPINPEHKEP
jgi:hypothetical protein